MNIHAQALGRIKTKKKARASRKNGKLGGRPKSKTPNPMGEISSGGRNYRREYVRMRDKHTCQKCGRVWIKGQRRFDVHHLEESMFGKNRMNGVVKYDRENMDKLITFCHKCHFAWHAKRDHLKSYSKKIILDTEIVAINKV